MSRRWTTVTERGEAGEEGGLLHGGVAAADHDDVLVAEEEAVAGRAPGHAAAGELVLVRQAELAVPEPVATITAFARCTVPAESVTA